jgi:hypothetical protein
LLGNIEQLQAYYSQSSEKLIYYRPSSLIKIIKKYEKKRRFHRDYKAFRLFYWGSFFPAGEGGGTLPRWESPS